MNRINKLAVEDVSRRLRERSLFAKACEQVTDEQALQSLLREEGIQTLSIAATTSIDAAMTAAQPESGGDHE
jgi:hypothetical protein